LSKNEFLLNASLIIIELIISIQWTTDQDVTDAILDLGINDIFEVKFFENRANGQSKGFCVVTLGSDNSVRAVIEKLPKRYFIQNTF